LEGNVKTAEVAGDNFSFREQEKIFIHDLSPLLKFYEIERSKDYEANYGSYDSNPSSPLRPLRQRSNHPSGV
jgi:hypothetical protein